MKKLFSITFLLLISWGCFAQAKQSPDQGAPATDENLKGLTFVVTEKIRLISVEVWSAGGGGQMEVSLLDDNDIIINSHTVMIPPKFGRLIRRFTIDLAWIIPPGDNYKIVASNPPLLSYDQSSTLYPYNINDKGRVFSGFSGNQRDDNSYYYFYNWIVQ